MVTTREVVSPYLSNAIGPDTPVVWVRCTACTIAALAPAPTVVWRDRTDDTADSRTFVASYASALSVAGVESKPASAYACKKSLPPGILRTGAPSCVAYTRPGSLPTAL